MDRILSYGLMGVIGVSGSTIAAAIIGSPLPVVSPAVLAGGIIAAHHAREKDTDAATDDDVREHVEQVEADGGREL
ncbi:hypothetical protein AMS69_05675 [Haloarcula rubripromontorii]|uniref:Uncharacterized protein n=1 Tax=Haloarcula rubripromontorii TaxID=1705562 RepID=A0A0N0U9T7_9EURY|nr:hypothetical protein [Haloarcula rubripromontorii]KOX93414.1 hypothetical protein AMS69_05675 [Haloarcula rubripromontorii]